jgi:hypothetical protein
LLTLPLFFVLQLEVAKPDSVLRDAVHGVQQKRSLPMHSTLEELFSDEELAQLESAFSVADDGSSSISTRDISVVLAELV